MKYNENEVIKNNKGIVLTDNAFKIGEAAILGMLYEVSASPSPGLVSPYSTGAHSDMDFFTFLKSTSSIAYSMYLCAQIGIDNPEGDILKQLRKIGIMAENRMFKATEGVNTQKGLLFLQGVISASAGRCISRKLSLNRFNISKLCSEICSGLVDKELKSIKHNKNLSNGEKLYIEKGFKGIRGEVEMGLPVVINHGIPAYEDALKSGLEIKKALCHSLVSIMTAVEDTTVLNRCGLDGLCYMRSCAKKAIELGGMKTKQGEEYITDLDSEFIKRKISPGGAADLLAATVMIYKLEDDEVKN